MHEGPIITCFKLLTATPISFLFLISLPTSIILAISASSLFPLETRLSFPFEDEEIENLGLRWTQGHGLSKYEIITMSNMVEEIYSHLPERSAFNLELGVGTTGTRDRHTELYFDDEKEYDGTRTVEEIEGEEEVKKAYRAAREETDEKAEMADANKVSSTPIDMVESMLQNSEKETDNADAEIGDRWKILVRDYDDKVEVAAAAMYLKDTLGKGAQELKSYLSNDKGKELSESCKIWTGQELKDTELLLKVQDKTEIAKLINLYLGCSFLLWMSVVML